MGVYWYRCEKCGKTWAFCSVGETSMIGEKCSCDKKYHVMI